jgi:hypothetical protein
MHVSRPIRQARRHQLQDLAQIPSAVVLGWRQWPPTPARPPRRRPRPPPHRLLQTGDVRQGPTTRTGRRPELAQQCPPRIPNISSCTARPGGCGQSWSLSASTPQITAHYGGCMCSSHGKQPRRPRSTDPPVIPALAMTRPAATGRQARSCAARTGGGSRMPTPRDQWASGTISARSPLASSFPPGCIRNRVICLRMATTISGGNEMTQPIAANGPLLTVRNLAVVVAFIAVALVLSLVAARTGQSGQAVTQVHHISHPWR